MLKFLYYYLRSMRLYYGFVTATTVLAGLYQWHRFGSGTDSALHSAGWTLRDAALLAMGFFAWGFNQIFSDWCDRKEDAINAPHRPMVTGALKPLPAFAVSAAGLAVIAVAGFLMSPWTLVFLALGGALNIAYSLLKRVPVLNCLVYACAISCCALFAIAGMAKRCPTLDEFGFVAVWIVPVHFLMCHNSYYKDVKGDRAAGVRTLQTSYHKYVAELVSIAFVGLAIFAAGIMHGEGPLKKALVILILAIAVAFQCSVEKMKYHRATCFNCQLCVLLLHVRFFAMTWPYAIASLIAIPLLFLWYNDEKE
ncbi:MAG: UbiA family prenyltransferase [Kiritimatiellae bacterium]|nr:UbiA family prenyltransferase [Kiritimatiellia bacterium]